MVLNDNWKESQESEIAATMLAPAKDLESAILQTLAPGAYTAIVRGQNSASGVALVEVYDLDQVTDSKLANISTRGFVQTGDNVMIGGFIIGGVTADSTVILRALGPSLADAGVSDPLLDPSLNCMMPTEHYLIRTITGGIPSRQLRSKRRASRRATIANQPLKRAWLPGPTRE